MSEKKWRFKLDWQPAVAVDALVVYHKRFPPSRNLVGMVTSSDGTDPWWREVLTQMHVTPQPIRGEAHLSRTVMTARKILPQKGLRIIQRKRILQTAIIGGERI